MVSPSDGDASEGDSARVHRRDAGPAVPGRGPRRLQDRQQPRLPHHLLRLPVLHVAHAGRAKV